MKAVFFFAPVKQWLKDSSKTPNFNTQADMTPSSAPCVTAAGQRADDLADRGISGAAKSKSERVPERWFAVVCAGGRPFPSTGFVMESVKDNKSSNKNGMPWLNLI